LETSTHGKDRVEEVQKKGTSGKEPLSLLPSLQAGLTSPSLVDYGHVLFDGLHKWIGHGNRDRKEA